MKNKVENSGTKVEFYDDWLVFDFSNGHNSHLRANVLLDRYVENIDKSGKQIKMDEKIPFISEDIQNLVLKNKVFDNIISSLDTILTR